MEKSEAKDYDGFEMPKYTQTPNKFYDEVIKEIDTLSEMKVTQVIIRQTFGWHKKSDRISHSQLVERTGLSRGSVKNGLERGIERGTIVKVSEYDSEKNQAAKYALNLNNFDIDPPSPKDYPRGGEPSPKDYREASPKEQGEALPQDLTPQNKYNKEILNKLASYGLDKNSNIADAVNKVWVNARSDAVHKLSTYLDDGINKLPIILAVIKTQEESEKEDKKIANKLNYCKGILNDWLEKKVYTTADVLEDDKKFEKLKQSYKDDNSRNKSSPKETTDNTGIPIDI